MLRLKVPGVVDLLIVDDPSHMRWLNDHPLVTRELSPAGGLLHHAMSQRLTRDLRFPEGLLPAFLVRESEYRKLRREELELRFNRVAGVETAQTRKLAEYVAGRATEAEMFVAVQAWCGQLFRANYVADDESYRAGELVAGWPTRDPMRASLLKRLGRLSKAKQILARSAGYDLHCVHGTSIGMMNVVHSLQAMRRWAIDPKSAEASTRTAVLRSLSAPPAAVRACRDEISAPFLDAPLTRHTLIVFLLRRMYERDFDTGLAFMSGGWNACPARHAIIDMLANVWEAALPAKAPRTSREGSRDNGRPAVDGAPRQTTFSRALRIGRERALRV